MFYLRLSRFLLSLSRNLVHSVVLVSHHGLSHVCLFLLAVRMKAHQQNGLAVASFLAASTKVTKVLYPGSEHMSN